MTDAADLLAAARRLMVEVTCPRCRTPVAWVRDSRYGPLLLLEHPADDAPALLRMMKVAKAVKVTEHPAFDPKGRERIIRRGERLPYHPENLVRVLEPEGSPADDWFAQEVHCHSHRRLSVTRTEVLASVDRFRRWGTVARVQASIPHSGGPRR